LNESPDPEQQRRERNKIGLYAMYAGLGLSLTTEMAASGAVGWWLGSMFDDKMNSKPFGMMAGIVLFLAAALVHITIILKKMEKKMEDAEREEKKKP